MVRMIKVELFGDDALVRKLDGLTLKLQKRVLRSATAKSTQPVLKAARSNAKRIADTGLLAESLGKKTKTYKGAVATIVGPRTGFKRLVRAKFTKKLPGQKEETVFKDVYRDPTNYAHLAEGYKQPARPHRILTTMGVYRREVTVWHPGVVRARPWLRPAWYSNLPTTKALMKKYIAAGVVKVAKEPA